jgi:hypothetical protein
MTPVSSSFGLILSLTSSSVSLRSRRQHCSIRYDRSIISSRMNLGREVLVAVGEIQVDAIKLTLRIEGIPAMRDAILEEVFACFA